MKNTFADRLKSAMAEANMNQAALSEKSGASRASISNYLSGKGIPKAGRMESLAAALGVSPDFLLEFDAPARIIPVKKITVKSAAQCMGKSEQFIRIGLQRGILPFGSAVPGIGANWSYYISPSRFRDYVGAQQFDQFFNLDR